LSFLNIAENPCWELANELHHKLLSLPHLKELNGVSLLEEEEEEEEDDENRETGYQEDVDDVSDEDPEMVLKEVIKTRYFNSITLSNKINLDQFFFFFFFFCFPQFSNVALLPTIQRNI
jgi:hypothetical protein